MNLFDWFSVHATEVIAISALFFTAYQTLATRKHNRLSVKPHLCAFTHKDFNNAGTEIKFTLHNNGLGPALIKSFQILLNDEIIKIKDADAIEPYLENILKDKKFTHAFTSLAIDYALKAGEEVDILKISTEVKDKNEIKSWMNDLNKFDLKIVYESMYGEEESYNSKEDKAKNM